MKLVTLTKASMVASAVGMLALIGAGGLAYERMRAKQAEVADLLALKQDIGAFSVAADHLMLFSAGPELTAAVRAQGRSIQERLAALSKAHPDARSGVHLVDVMLRGLPKADTGASAPPADPGAGLGPLALSLRQQTRLSEIANHGIALDTAIDEVLQRRRRAIARSATWIAAGFAGAAALFAAFSVAAFGAIHRRLGTPVHDLLQSIESVETGDAEARAPASGTDELAELGAAFNRMRDRQRAADDSIETLVDQLKQREAELERSRDELATALDIRTALINALPAHICLLDGRGDILDVNDQWRAFGLANEYAGDDLGKGRNYLEICDRATGDCAEEAHAAAAGLRDVLAGRRETFDLEYPCHSPDQARWFRLLASRLPPARRDGTGGRAVVMHVDITERKLGEREMQRAVYEDRLTGLYSRTGFAASLGARLAQGSDHPGSLVVVLDIVALRDVNEAYGYDVGDDVIAQAGRRLRDAVGAHGLVGRIGGDEFAVFAPVWRGSGPRARRTAIARAFETPFRIDDASITVSARFGYTRIGRRERSPDDLVREAELALFQTRPRAGDLWCQYTAGLDRAARARIRLTGELRDALARNEFQLHFQPKVDLASGRVLSCEALIRWNHPERGLLLPGAFMPVAEQSQLIGPIGDWVLGEACRTVRAWREAGLSVVRVSVNVSMVQLAMGDFPDKVRNALSAEGVAPGDVTLEITESVFEEASRALQRQLMELHAMGVRLSLDDFGTGYSSLLYLQQYPFDEIKVDKGFVRHMLTDRYSREIVATVAGVAGAVNAEAVAEGVESPAERDALLDMGCRIGQGFYYSMPLAEEDFRWVLEHGEGLPLGGAAGAGGS